MEKKLYSVTDMKNDLKKIINQIKISKLDPELIISINRGGCIPGIYLSHYLKKTHRVIDIQLRDSDSKPNFDVMKDSLNNFNKILIIDDINDSGLTFGLVKKLIGNSNCKTYFAALINNKKSKTKIDFHGQLIDKSINPVWYVFPWEKWW